MTTIAFVPAKGHSERVPGKNLRLLNGEPLVAYTVRKLLTCPFLDAVYVQSDDDRILRVSEQLGAKTLRLTKAETALDGHGIFAQGVQAVPEAEVYVQVMCTSPFVRPETIQEMMRWLGFNGTIGSAALGYSHHGYPWPHRDPYPRSQTLPTTDYETTGCYVVDGDVARKQLKRVTHPSYFHFGRPHECIDIDTEADLALAQCVAKGLHQQEVNRLTILKTVLSSAALSDAGAIHVDLGSRAYMNHSTVFGHAKPMSLRPKSKTDDGSIYEALSHYDYVAQNDVLVVHHQCGDLAYFGELNASLAIRAGASGYVSNGPLRDIGAIRRLGFPCWVPCATPQDVKETACVESINEPVNVNGTMICPQDPIFADSDGVVVLPWRDAEAIIEKALAAVQIEGQVKADVVRGVPATAIHARQGAF